jgi:hypothetical protein
MDKRGAVKKLESSPKIFLTGALRAITLKLGTAEQALQAKR